MEPSAKEWNSNADHAPKAAFAKFRGNYLREYVSLFNNLEKIRKLLSDGNKLGAFHINFFRHETRGIYRIGQTSVPAAKESRLYVYPDLETQTIHILMVGEKDDQESDLKEALRVLATILKPEAAA